MSDLPFNGLTKDNWRGRLAFVLNEKLYQQGSGQLRVRKGPWDLTEKHCCLGVLCEIAGIPGDLPADQGDSYAFDGETGELPQTLAEHLDITTAGDLLHEYETLDKFDEANFSSALTELNDDTDIGFAGIAKVLLDDKVEFKPFNT